MKKALLILIMAIALPQMAFAAIPSSEIYKEVMQKEQQAIRLINRVGVITNERFSNEEDKFNAQYAFNGYISSFQNIKEEIATFEQKQLIPDDQTLTLCSKRLDKLIRDLQIYLK